MRIQPDLVLDLECSKISLQTGIVGKTPEYNLFPWFYYPLVTSNSNHPIVKSLDRVNFYFPSSIDTIKTKTNIKKTILLTSSKYSRKQDSPVRLNFEILRYDPQPEKFNHTYFPLAVLLEGQFPSLFENRVSKELEDGLQTIGQTFKPVSKSTRQIVVSDGDLARNGFNQSTGEIRPLGYNVFERRIFANKNFLTNCIEYLIEGEGVIEARSREVKLRLLDVYKIREEKTFWQVLNIVLPIVLLGIFGFVFNWYRKKKYSAKA